MRVLKGIGVFKGIAFGKFRMLQKSDFNIQKKAIENLEKEIARYRDANEIVLKELDKLYQKAMETVGDDEAMIFQIHQMMLKDIDFVSCIEETIKNEMVNAEYSVHKACEKFSQLFSSMEDSYMKERRPGQ